MRLYSGSYRTFLSVTQDASALTFFLPLSYLPPQEGGMVEKVRRINGRYYVYNVYWQKTDRGWKKRSDYLRPFRRRGMIA
jgi:hypothetical protein